MIYQACQAQSDLMWPLRTLAKMSAPLLQDPGFGLAAPSSTRQVAAACKVLELAKVPHKRPPWRIDSVVDKGRGGDRRGGVHDAVRKDRHVNAFKGYYQHLVDDEFDQAQITRTFHEEYMAVADLSTDFYIETVDQVFQKHALPRGERMFRGRRVNPAAFRRTALVTIEGERYDIRAIGQTLAAQDLASSLRPYKRTRYVQPNVGH